MNKFRKSSFLTNKFLFMAGFLSPLNFQFAGKIYLIELFFLVIVVKSLFTRPDLKIPVSGQVANIFLLAILSAFMGSIGSLANGLAVTSLVKGISLIVFFIIDCYAVILISKKQIGNVTLLYTGIAMSSIVRYFLAPDEYTRSSPWKFCFASAVSMFLILRFPEKISKSYLNFLLICLSGLNFYFSFRIEGALLLSTFLIISYGKRFRVHRDARIRVTISAILLIFCLGSIYTFASNAGIFGSNLQSKSIIQSSGKYGILLGGRNEAAFSLPAIKEKPFLGWGFYAPPTDSIIDKGLQFLYDNQVNTAYQKKVIFELNQIPTHSYLMQFMVFGGILAGVMWLYVLKIISQFMLVVISSRADGNLDYFVVYVSLLTSWAILFSPFGAFERVNVGIAIAFLSIYMATPKVSDI